MGVKRGNLKIISGLLLPPFILNYILIRVKGRGWNKKNRKNKERQKKGEKRTRKRRNEKKNKALGLACLISNLRWR